jgi:hypothetical protein
VDDIEDQDFFLYLLLGAAVVYFLYKNNVFGAPAAAAGSGVPLLPAPTPATSGTSAPAAAASSSAANQGPAVGPANPDFDFGIIDTAAGW